MNLTHLSTTLCADAIPGYVGAVVLSLSGTVWAAVRRRGKEPFVATFSILGELVREVCGDYVDRHDNRRANCVRTP